MPEENTSSDTELTADVLSGVLDEVTTSFDFTPETAKTEATKTEATKTEATKTEAAKTEATKTEATKTDLSAEDILKSSNTKDIPDSLFDTPKEGGKPEESDKPTEASKTQEELSIDDPKMQSISALRQRAEDQQRIIDNLKSEATKTKPQEIPIEELTKLREENQKLIQEISRENLAKSPEFQKKWDSQLQQVSGVIRNAATQFEVPETELNKIAALGLRARYDYLMDNYPDATSTLVPMFTQLDQVNFAKNAELQAHSSKAQEYRLEAMQKESKQVEEFRKVLKDTTMSELSKEGHFIFKEIEGNDAWNAKVKQFQTGVDTLYQSNDIKLQSKALALSVAAPVYLQLFNETRAELISARAELKKYKSGTPTISTGTGGTTSSPTSVDGIISEISGEIFK